MVIRIFLKGEVFFIIIVLVYIYFRVLFIGVKMILRVVGYFLLVWVVFDFILVNVGLSNEEGGRVMLV